jgi:hypothetical protein
MAECCVCLRKYDRAERKPRCLPCGHAMCADCVTKADAVRAQAAPDNPYQSLGCPVCRKPVPDWLALPVNHPMLDVSTVFTASMAVALPAAGKGGGVYSVSQDQSHHCSCLPQSTQYHNSKTVPRISEGQQHLLSRHFVMDRHFIVPATMK